MVLTLGLSGMLALSAATGATSSNVSPFIGMGIGPGISLSGDNASFQIAARGGVELKLPVDRLQLALFLPIRMTVGSRDDRNVHTSLFNYSFVPTARGAFEVVDKLRAYMDFGAGIAFFNSSANVPFFGTVTTNTTAGEFNVALGVDYRVHPNISLFFEPMSFRIFTSGSGTSRAGNFTTDVQQDSGAIWTMMLGAHFVF